MTRKKTHEEFIAEVYSLRGEEYTVIGEYVLSHIKIEFFHSVCGTYYKARPKKFVSGSGCPVCANARKGSYLKKTSSDFEKEFYAILGNDYSLKSEYRGAHKKVVVVHNKCGREYSVSPTSILRGTGCKTCNLERGNSLRRKSNEDYELEVFSLVGREYEVIEKYINVKTKIKMLHLECGFEFEMTPNAFLRGNRCPTCASSKGENSIRKFLEHYNIEFVSEVRFEECRSKNPLPFDFHLPDYNLLIEYQGIQHYKPVDKFGGKKKLAIQKKRDKIKRKFCRDNNINLLEIPYTEFKNINTILSNSLL